MERKAIHRSDILLRNTRHCLVNTTQVRVPVTQSLKPRSQLNLNGGKYTSAGPQRDPRTKSPHCSPQGHKREVPFKNSNERRSSDGPAVTKQAQIPTCR